MNRLDICDQDHNANTEIIKLNFYHYGIEAIQQILLIAPTGCQQILTRFSRRWEDVSSATTIQFLCWSG